MRNGLWYACTVFLKVTSKEPQNTTHTKPCGMADIGNAPCTIHGMLCALKRLTVTVSW